MGSFHGMGFGEPFGFDPFPGQCLQDHFLVNQDSLLRFLQLLNEPQGGKLSVFLRLDARSVLEIHYTDFPLEALEAFDRRKCEIRRSRRSEGNFFTLPPFDLRRGLPFLLIGR